MSAMHGVSEAVLIQTAQSGFPEGSKALSSLLDRFSPIIRNLAFKYALNYHDRQDLLQEGRLSFVAAVRRFDPGKGNKLSTYAFRYIRGRMLNWIRREQKARLLGRTIQTSDLTCMTCQQTPPSLAECQTDIEALEDKNPASNPLYSLWLQEVVSEVDAACKILTPKQRAAVRLRFWDDKCHADIADILEVSRPRITSLLASAFHYLEPSLRCVA